MNKFSKALFVICLASMFITVSGCQETEQVSKSKDIAIQSKPLEASNTTNRDQEIASEPKGTPSIKFEKLVHDFGKIGPNAYSKFEFKFKNTGNAKLIFPRKPYTPCGCTVLGTLKMEYAPGETGVISGRYRANAVPGKVTKHITVYTNDPKNAQVDLKIKAEIEIAIEATPKVINLNLKNVDSVPPIVITAKDNQPFSIKSFTSTSSTITANIDTTKKAVMHTILPKVDLEKLKTRLNGNININLDHPNTKQVLLRYSALPEAKLNPPLIFLQDPDPDNPVKREVMVISNYNEKIEIKSIKSARECIKVISKKRIGNNIQLVIEITPPPKKDRIRVFHDYLTITINDGYTLTLKASGVYRMKRTK